MSGKLPLEDRKAVKLSVAGIIKILCSCQTFVGKYDEFIDHLQIERANYTSIISNHRMGTIQIYQLFSSIVYGWISMMGSKATPNALMVILKSMKCNAVAENIEKTFNEVLTKPIVPPRNFLEPDMEFDQQCIAHLNIGASEVSELCACTIGLDKSTSPIHICTHIHIFCGHKTCVKSQVSAWEERISPKPGLTLTCPNKNSGCNVEIEATEMKNHLQNCYFREIICTEEAEGTCDTKVAMNEYSKHLQERHKCFVSTTGNFTTKMTDENGFAIAGQWQQNIVEKDGNTFLLHGQIEADLAYFWMTVLGSKETAEKYMYEFKLFKTMDRGRKITATWVLPVVAFHDQPKYTEDSTFYVTIPAKTIKEFSTPVNITDKLHIRFCTSFRIL